VVGEQRSVEDGLEVAGSERLTLRLVLFQPHLAERIRPRNVLGHEASVAAPSCNRLHGTQLLVHGSGRDLCDGWMRAPIFTQFRQRCLEQGALAHLRHQLQRNDASSPRSIPSIVLEAASVSTIVITLLLWILGPRLRPPA
jgi:hypothetical protein